jgi:hypothetical protein
MAWVIDCEFQIWTYDLNVVVKNVGNNEFNRKLQFKIPFYKIQSTVSLRIGKKYTIKIGSNVINSG